MYRTLAKAALSIAPVPLPNNPKDCLSRLEQEAFAASTALSFLMDTIYTDHRRRIPTEGLDNPAWTLWERCHHIHKRLSTRYTRRRLAREAFEQEHTCPDMETTAANSVSALIPA